MNNITKPLKNIFFQWNDILISVGVYKELAILSQSNMQLEHMIRHLITVVLKKASILLNHLYFENNFINGNTIAYNIQ